MPKLSTRSAKTILRCDNGTPIRGLAYFDDPHYTNGMFRSILAILMLVSGLWCSPSVAFSATTHWTWPNGEGPFPVLLLVTSEKGPNGFFNREIERWRDAEYAIYTVDLFQEKIAANDQEANQLRDQLNLENSARVLDQAISQIKGSRKADATRIGLLSWGAGASHSLRWMRGPEKVRAAALVSANPIRERDELKKIRSRIFFAYPSQGTAFSKSDLQESQTLLQQARVPYEWKEYLATAPLCMDFTDQKKFMLAASDQLRRDVLTFFNKHVAFREYK